MGLSFYLGLIIYLLILLTLMVWFLNSHGNDNHNYPKYTTNDTEKKDEDGASPSKPNQISTKLKQSGGQSTSEKSEVLPGYCSQPNNVKIL